MYFLGFQMYKTCLKCAFWRVEPMMVLADTNQGMQSDGSRSDGLRLTDCIFFVALLLNGWLNGIVSLKQPAVRRRPSDRVRVIALFKNTILQSLKANNNMYSSAEDYMSFSMNLSFTYNYSG